ncbi:MAG: HD domain-containing protein [Egibacteraceae bacterium]
MATAHLTARLAEAFAYAAAAHAGQLRKGTALPYVSHLLSVAALVLDDGGSETEAIAALLHDVVEDQGGHERLLDVRTRFGDAVGDIVAACTDYDTTGERGPWRQRKEAYVAHIPAMPPAVRRVSLADKLHNARAILRDYRLHGEAVWERFNSDGADQRWYLGALTEAFAEASDSPMVDDLRLTVAELEQLATASG